MSRRVRPTPCRAMCGINLQHCKQALKPPGALSNQTPEAVQPLLMDLRLVGVDRSPSRQHETHAEVEILGEGRGRPRLATQRLQRAEPRELSVATQTGESRPATTPLEYLGVADELHVLEAREQPGVAVPDANRDLHGADAWVGEAGGCHIWRVTVKPPIGIQQTDDDLVGGTAVEHRAFGQILHGRIECGALALPRLRKPPPEQEDIPVHPRLDHGSRSIVGSVVDDENDRLLPSIGAKPVQGRPDHPIFVETRDDEDEEQIRCLDRPVHPVPEWPSRNIPKA